MAHHHHHGVGGLPGIIKYCTPGAQHDGSDRFGRMFDLPANYVPAHVLNDIGRVGGPMDGGDNPDESSTVDVGHVFFGQFIDHDITLDVTSSLTGVVNDATAIPNVRTPQLDLDCVYGAGPEAQPYMYRDGIRLATGEDHPDASSDDTIANDLQRNHAGTAMIGDFRNDENRIVSQLQLGMIRFHNARCDHWAAHGYEGKELYEKARQDVTFHYQWCVVFDFLASICGRPVVDSVLTSGRKFYCGAAPYIPVEFSVAAYRFGHSMVPFDIQLQKGDNRFELFAEATTAILGKGFEPVADVRAIADWHELFTTPEGRVVQKAVKLDTKLMKDLLDLTVVADTEPAENRSLPARNLRRGNAFLLPAGEVVARHMQAELDLTDQQIDDTMAIVETVSNGHVAGAGAPLWLYLLAEAEAIGRAEPDGTTSPGEGLGPVGARIVAEVVIGLLEMDEQSFLGANRDWLPDPAFDSIGKLLASTNWSGLPT